MWIVYPLLIQPFDPPRVAAVHALRGQDPRGFRIPVAVFAARRLRITAFLDTLLGDKVKKIDPAPALCDRGSCGFVAGEKVLYFDPLPLSLAGARFVASRFDPLVTAAARSTSR